MRNSNGHIEATGMLGLKNDRIRAFFKQKKDQFLVKLSCFQYSFLEVTKLLTSDKRKQTTKTGLLDRK